MFYVLFQFILRFGKRLIHVSNNNYIILVIKLVSVLAFKQIYSVLIQLSNKSFDENLTRKSAGPAPSLEKSIKFKLSIISGRM